MRRFLDFGTNRVLNWRWHEIFRIKIPAVRAKEGEGRKKGRAEAGVGLGSVCRLGVQPRLQRISFRRCDFRRRCLDVRQRLAEPYPVGAVRAADHQPRVFG